MVYNFIEKKYSKNDNISNDNITNDNISSYISLKTEEINRQFKLPIYYNDKKQELNKNIINDLELVSTVEQNGKPIYDFCFNNDNDVSKIINKQITKYYTTDVEFLKDNQTLLKDYKCVVPDSKYNNYSNNYKKILDIWSELRVEQGFKEKYYYLEWEALEFLNKSEMFLQIMSIYNLFSPVLSFLMPIIILIIPFFVIKLKGLPITISGYFDVLKTVGKQNAIGKLFLTNFSEIDGKEKMYILASAGFYLFTIYQNIMVCIKYHSNMKVIHNHFYEMGIYLNKTIVSMENYLKYSSSLNSESHKKFNDKLTNNLSSLKQLYNKVTFVSEYSILNYNKINEIGFILKYFYEFHNEQNIDDAILFSIGFNGYIDCLDGLQKNIEDGKMNFANYVDNCKKSVITNCYYACLKDDNPVKNTIKMKKNIIITGPNASGKTTILKSVLINIILSQQFGCGFYSSAKLIPFKNIHCYLNIPDTSGRDSLFQAEARRCKEILDAIGNDDNDNDDDNDDSNHFCAFDELYSGTNPEEAELSATSFMKYLSKRKNVCCLLTTHFNKVCKNLENNKNVINCHMEAKKDDENGQIQYSYLLKNGISNIRGGLSILTQMNYPKEIIDNASI